MDARHSGLTMELEDSTDEDAQAFARTLCGVHARVPEQGMPSASHTSDAGAMVVAHSSRPLLDLVAVLG